MQKQKTLFIGFSIVIAILLALVAVPTAPVAAAQETPIVTPVTNLAAPPQDSCSGQFNVHPDNFYTIEVHVDETPAGTAIDGNGNPITGDFPPGTDQTKGTVPKGMWANFYLWDGWSSVLIGYAQITTCDLGGDLQVFYNDIWAPRGWNAFVYQTLTVQTKKGWKTITYLKQN